MEKLTGMELFTAVECGFRGGLSPMSEGASQFLSDLKRGTMEGHLFPGALMFSVKRSLFFLFAVVQRQRLFSVITNVMGS